KIINMSIFGNLFGGDSGPVTLNKQEAFAGILLSIIAADGQITQEEGQDFISTLQRARLMNSVNNNQFRDMMNKLQKYMRKNSPEALVDLCAEHLPAEYANGTFAYACDLVFSDGTADESEQKLLDQIKLKLNIDDSLAYKVGEVLMIKNKI
ncbi:MAG: tellurite resistance TerB family protein, partial [Bacteroidota bacterium]